MLLHPFLIEFSERYSPFISLLLEIGNNSVYMNVIKLKIKFVHSFPIYLNDVIASVKYLYVFYFRFLSV